VVDLLMSTANPPLRPEDSPAVPDAPATNTRRVAVAGGVGTFIEGYDFSMYGYMSVFLAPAFFTSEDPFVSLLLALVVFAVSYVMRPLGGLVFGHLGDRVDRRTALLATIVLMGCASALISVLPTYAQAGVLGPILLVLLRLVQGLAMGGELAGAATLVSEAASSTRRGWFGAFNPAGATLGFAFASGTAGLVSGLLDADQMADWGWRLPFLVAVPLTIASFFLRRSLTTGAEKTSHGGGGLPIVRVLREKPLQVLQGTMLGIAVSGTTYFGLTYIAIHMISTLKYGSSATFWVTTAVVVIVALAMPFAGALGDRIGLGRMAMIGLAGFFALSYAGLTLINTGSLGLAAVGFLLIMANSAFVQVGGYTITPRLFDADVRYTATALCMNLGVVIAGGTAPVLCVWLTKVSGNLAAAAFFAMTAAAVGAVGLLAAGRRSGVLDRAGATG
jgi:MFS transporter, MHS family, proline/betaine transporter